MTRRPFWILPVIVISQFAGGSIWFTGNAVLGELMRDWSTFFERHPVLLSPTWALPAFDHDADLSGDEIAGILRDTLRPVLPGNVLGLPAAIVPCGFAANLPVGVQVIGDRFTDLRCLSIAEQIQDAEGVHTPIDPVIA